MPCTIWLPSLAFATLMREKGRLGCRSASDLKPTRTCDQSICKATVFFDVLGLKSAVQTPLSKVWTPLGSATTAQCNRTNNIKAAHIRFFLQHFWVRRNFVFFLLNAKKCPTCVNKPSVGTRHHAMHTLTHLDGTVDKLLSVRNNRLNLFTKIKDSLSRLDVVPQGANLVACILKPENLFRAGRVAGSTDPKTSAFDKKTLGGRFPRELDTITSGML